MAARFVPIDRDTPLLLPPNLRDLVPADHLVHFILDAVDALDLRQIKVNTRGTGSEQYPPHMLLGLLLYSYATGILSSRRIEQSTYDSVPVRLLTADTHPDHDTLCTFRRENQALLTESFVKVLQLAQQLKVLQFRQLTVAADGTKVLASASKHSAVSYERAGEMIAQLELEVRQLLAKAEQADASPLQDGLTIPAEITRRQERQAALAQPDLRNWRAFASASPPKSALASQRSVASFQLSFRRDPRRRLRRQLPLHLGQYQSLIRLRLSVAPEHQLPTVGGRKVHIHHLDPAHLLQHLSHRQSRRLGPQLMPQRQAYLHRARHSVRWYRLPAGKQGQLGLSLRGEVEGLDAPQPGFPLRIVDLAQVEHVPFHPAPASTRHLLGDAVVAVVLAVFDPLVALQIHSVGQTLCPVQGTQKRVGL